MVWDKEKAVRYLQLHVNGKSIGQCAAYTRRAIEAGGVVLSRHQYARDYGLSLMSAGFLELGRDLNHYKAGDVVIFNGVNESHPEGHMAMYDGTVWISDFKQQSFYPGAAFRNVSYKTCRHSSVL